MKTQWDCQPFQFDPSWYELCWLTGRPEKPRRPTNLVLIAFALLRRIRLRPLVVAPRQALTPPEVWMQFD